jgi:hypothetical protein
LVSNASQATIITEAVDIVYFLPPLPACNILTMDILRQLQLFSISPGQDLRILLPKLQPGENDDPPPKRQCTSREDGNTATVITVLLVENNGKNKFSRPTIYRVTVLTSMLTILREKGESRATFDQDMLKVDKRWLMSRILLSVHTEEWTQVPEMAVSFLKENLDMTMEDIRNVVTWTNQTSTFVKGSPIDLVLIRRGYF